MMLKKMLGMMALTVMICTTAYASMSHSDPEYAGEVSGDVAKREGAPVGYRQNPGVQLANELMTFLKVDPLNVMQMNRNTTQPDGPAPAGAAVSQGYWDMPIHSAIRYEHTEFDDVDDDADRYGVTVRAMWDYDWMTINVALPIDRVNFGGDNYDDFDFTRMALVVTPRLHLMSQDTQWCDLSFGFNTFYSYTWFSDSDALERLIPRDEDGTFNTTEDDSEHVGIGLMLTANKDFEMFSLGLGALWQNGHNIGGDEEFFDSSGNNRNEDISIIKVGANVGVPVGERWLINGEMMYHHTIKNFGDLDSDWMKVGLGATYVLNDSWTLDAAIDTDLGADDLDHRYQLSFGAVWAF